MTSLIYWTKQKRRRTGTMKNKCMKYVVLAGVSFVAGYVAGVVCESKFIGKDSVDDDDFCDDDFIGDSETEFGDSL